MRRTRYLVLISLFLLRSSVFSGDFLPDDDSAWDLGSSSDRWAEIYGVEGRLDYLLLAEGSSHAGVSGRTTVFDNLGSGEISVRHGTDAPVSLESLNLSVVTTSSNYSATTTDDIILVNTSGGSVTVTLPAASEQAGKRLTVKKITSDSNAMILDGNGTEEIDGETTYEKIEQYSSLSVFSDGVSDWYIEAGYPWAPPGYNVTSLTQDASGGLVVASGATLSVTNISSPNSLTLSSTASAINLNSGHNIIFTPADDHYVAVRDSYTQGNDLRWIVRSDADSAFYEDDGEEQLRLAGGGRRHSLIVSRYTQVIFSLFPILPLLPLWPLVLRREVQSTSILGTTFSLLLRTISM